MNKFLSVADVEDLGSLLERAARYKASPFVDRDLGKDKTLGLIFLNPSLRTRVSTQVAATNLGMQVIVFNAGSDGWQLEFGDHVVMDGEKVEHVREAARVLGSYFDIMAVRTFPGLKNKEEDYSETIINQFVRFAGVPVLSLESATLHPLQSLADLLTISHTFKEERKPKVVLSWAPHVKALPQAVPNSFAEWVNVWGQADFIITHPPGYELDPRFSGNAAIVHDQDAAFEGADFVYVKNWASYHDYGRILNTDPSWMITEKKLSGTNNARVMHCLPVRRNLVIADEVLDGKRSIVVEQARNRIYAAQAVLAGLLEGGNS